MLRVEMHFLPDVFVLCDACSGRRYNRETLEVKYRGLSIADALDVTVEQATELFGAVPRIADKLEEALRKVGLGYVKLGQPATTLSGGEAQRVKLARAARGGPPGGPSTSSTSRRRACTSPTSRSCSQL